MSSAAAPSDVHASILASGERRVRHARVCPTAADGAWALRQAMEDALRCASFDDAGRLVLVRRLRIAGLPAGAGAVLLTRALERAWRETARHAVPALTGSDVGTADEAAQAAAVWFASPAEAVLAALARSVEDVPLVAWFWSLAVPVLYSTPQARERVPLLVAQLQRLAPRSWQQALARWPLARRARLQALLAASDAAPPHAAVSDTHPTHALARATPSEAPQRRAATVLPDRTGPPLAQAVGSQVPPEVAQASVPLSAPSVAVHAPPLAMALDAVATDSELLPLYRSTALTSAAPTPTAQRGESIPAPPAARVPTMLQQPYTPPVAAAPEAPPAQQAAAVPRRQSRAPPNSPAPASFPWLRDAVFSPHAGALWLVNLLEGVGFGAEPPSLGLVHAVLGGLFRTAGLHADDPQWALLVPDAAPPPEPLARRWRVHARRVLRRQAGLSLAELVRRPGWVTLTLTHADLVFPLDAVDLRARRRGLDCDPGYVPWLGRILRFHFVARADWPAPEPFDG